MHAAVWHVCDHVALKSHFRGASAFRTNCREVAYVTKGCVRHPAGKPVEAVILSFGVGSAAADCRFGSSQLAGGELFLG